MYDLLLLGSLITSDKTGYKLKKNRWLCIAADAEGF